MGAKDLTDDQWRRLLERAPDRAPGYRRAGRPRSRADRIRHDQPVEHRPITLPRLRFLEKPFDEDSK